MAVGFKDMPKDWFAAYLNHWLAAWVSFFAYSSAEASGKYDGFSFWL